MSWFQKMAEEFSRSFGLEPMPLHDADLPDEPSATSRPLLRAVVDTSAQRPTGGTAGIRSADRPAAPNSPGAAGTHPSQWPADDYEAVGREYLAKLYNLMAQLGDLCADVVELIEHVDPTPTGLASAHKRKSRPSRE